MKYQELRKIFREHEHSHPVTHLTAHITFAPESFAPDANYSPLERTYMISSDNKAFQPNKGGYSIFGSCLDGKSDPCIRLDLFMAEERGGKGSWIVENCCLVAYLLMGSNERDILIPQIFYVQEAAEDAMLRSLCKEGDMEYDDMKAIFLRDCGEFFDIDYSASRQGAWLNAPNTGNWDWVIRPVRIYDLLNISFEGDANNV